MEVSSGQGGILVEIIKAVGAILVETTREVVSISSRQLVQVIQGDISTIIVLLMDQATSLQVGL